MTQRRTTTADIMKEILAVRQELKDMQSNQAAFHTRLFALETDKVKKDAIAEFLLEHPTPTPPESKVNKELVKYIGVALTIIASLIASMAARP